MIFYEPIFDYHYLASLASHSCTFSNSDRHSQRSQAVLIFFHSTKPTLGRFNVRALKFSPPGRGMVYKLHLVSFSSHIESFHLHKHFRKARCWADASPPWRSRGGFHLHKKETLQSMKTLAQCTIDSEPGSE
jgi:hypothetical protein